MTKAAALNKFFSQFGLDAYPSSGVPEDVIFPYLTYEVATGDIYSGPIDIGVNLWFKTESEKIPNDKVEEIGNAIGLGGVMVPYDGGAIWIQKGTPFSQNLNDENNREIKNSTVKRRFIDLSLEFV